MAGSGTRPRLLVVGAGLGQVPAIRQGRALGMTTIALDRNAAAPGMRLADEAVEVDISSESGVVESARERRVTAVVTMQSDHGIVAAGAVVDALGLHGTSREAAAVCYDKRLLRRRLASTGVRQPDWVEAATLPEAVAHLEAVGPPVILKPACASGSSGVGVVRTVADLDDAWHNARQHGDGPVLVETFLEGREFGAQAFVHADSRVEVVFHGDTVTELPLRVPIGHSMPATLTDAVRQDAARQIRRAVDALGSVLGPVNVDLLAVGEEIYVLELSPRLGATCLPELLELHTGRDWTRAAIEVATGRAIPSGLDQPRAACAARVLAAPRRGTLVAVDGIERARGMAGVVEVEVEVPPGTVVAPLRVGTDRIGRVITRGPTAAAAAALAARVEKSIELRVEPA